MMQFIVDLNKEKSNNLNFVLKVVIFFGNENEIKIIKCFQQNIKEIQQNNIEIFDLRKNIYFENVRTEIFCINFIQIVKFINESKF